MGRTYLSVPTALFFSKRELVQAWTQFTASFLVMSSVIWHFNMFRALLPWFVYGNIFYVFSQIPTRTNPLQEGTATLQRSGLWHSYVHRRGTTSTRAICGCSSPLV